MTASTLRVISDANPRNGQSSSAVPFSQFLYIDFRHEQGIQEIVVATDVSARQRHLIAEHIHACGARKTIKLIDYSTEENALIH